MERETAELLARATAERDDAERAAKQAEQIEAIEALRAEQQAEAARRDALVANMIDQAIAAFAVNDFELAIEYADEALHEDPRNQKAREVRDAAFRAGRAQVRDDYVEAKREQFKRWREELAEMRVP